MKRLIEFSVYFNLITYIHNNRCINYNKQLCGCTKLSSSTNDYYQNSKNFNYRTFKSEGKFSVQLPYLNSLENGRYNIILKVNEVITNASKCHGNYNQHFTYNNQSDKHSELLYDISSFLDCDYCSSYNNFKKPVSVISSFSS